MTSILLPWPRSRFQDIVHPEDHLSGLGGLHQHLPLHAEALCNPQSGHAVNLALVLETKQRLTTFSCFDYRVSEKLWARMNAFYSKTLC